MYIIDLVIFKSSVCLVLEGNGNSLLCSHTSQRQRQALGRCSLLCLSPSPGEHLQSEGCSFWLSLRGSKSSHRPRTCSQEVDSIALPVKHALNEEGSTCVLGWVLKLTFGYSGDTLCLLTLPAYARSPFPVTRHYLLNKNCRDPKACMSPKE